MLKPDLAPKRNFAFKVTDSVARPVKGPSERDANSAVQDRPSTYNRLLVVTRSTSIRR